MTVAPIAHQPAAAAPALEVHLADRRRLLIEGASTTTTLLDIVAASRGLLAVDPSGAVPIDGRPVAGVARIGRSGIRRGSLMGGPIGDTAGTPGDPVEPTAILDVVWLTGVDAGGRICLPAGVHCIGRARSAAVWCADPCLELHHALLEVDASGAASVHQIAGRRPVVIDGVAIVGVAPVQPGQRVEIGGSVFVIHLSPARPAAGPSRPRPFDWQTEPSDPTFAASIPRHPTSSASAVSASPWLTPCVRSPRPLPVFVAEDIAAPRPTRVGNSHGAILPTIIGVIAAAILAFVFGQIMFLLFGLMGAVVAFGTWLAQRMGVLRSRRGAALADAAAFEAFRSALAAQRDLARTNQLASIPTIDQSIAAMHHGSRLLWQVRPADPDAFVVSIGEGEGTWQPSVTGLGDAPAEVWGAIESASRLGVLPCPVSLARGSIIAIAGGLEAVAVARSMIVQLAAASGPADWRLAIVTDRPHEWDGLAWLAHAGEPGGHPRIVASSTAAELVGGLDPCDERHLVVVLDGVEPLTTRTSPIRRLLAAQTSTACVVLCSSEAEMPAICTSALVVGRRGAARWIADTRVNALAETVRIAGVSAERAHDAAARIACLIDPEHSDEVGALPADIGMVDVLRDELGTDPATFAQRIAAGWSAAGVDPPAVTPIGIAVDGVVEIDLDRDGPHALLAGTTGAGKSELLRSLVLGLAVRSSPDHVTFVLVDYKGGATFDACAALPHTVGMVTDLDDRLAARALRSLEAELRRREHLLRAASASDLGEYRASCSGDPARPVLPRLVVVIDEFATLARQHPDFLGALVGIAQRGRSLGIHLVLATQRPNGVISDDIRANTNLRISLRVHDPADASDVVGDPGAARLPRSVPGRAIMRLGADERITFQTATCTRPLRTSTDGASLTVRVAGVAGVAGISSGPHDPHGGRADGEGSARSELQVVVDAIRHAARLNGVEPPYRPWLPPLSASIDSGALGSLDPIERGAAIGVIDDPDGQCRRPLTWTRAGHLLLVGSSASGLTSGLLAIVGVLERTTVEADLYVIDAHGDPRLAALGRGASGATLVRSSERERLLRMVEHLVGTIERCRSGGDRGTSRDTIVMIDGWAALRAELEADDQWTLLDKLGRIVAEGLAAGIRVVITASRTGAVTARYLGLIAERWIFHLNDPLDAGLLGVAAECVPGPIPGRLYDSASGCEAQIISNDSNDSADGTDLAADRADIGADHVRSATDPSRSHLGRLPSEVDVHALPDAVAGGGDLLAPIGIDFESLQPAVLSVAAGEHVLVLGPARSGRTSALGTIADRWSGAHRDGWIGCVAARRSSSRAGHVFGDLASLLTAIPAGVPALVVIDDAELVDDTSGRLTAYIVGRADGLTVIAAGRPDALRSSYGHWTAAVRRSRLGLVMAAGNELDGDLLGAMLPRRLPIAARPGLGWLIADGDRRLIQVARADARDAALTDGAGALPHSRHGDIA